MSPIIVKVAVPIRLYRLFDYVLPDTYKGGAQQLKKGMRVQVPFGKRELIGFIIEVAHQTELPKNRLRPITAILDQAPLFSKSIIKLIEWTSRYYHHPLGESMEMALPTRLRKLKPIRSRSSTTQPLSDRTITSQQLIPTLTVEQQHAVERITQSFNQFQVFLLQGVTGSGKTEVYLRLIDANLKDGKQALLLIPEISLTPQMVDRLQHRFGEKIALFHSQLTDIQRLRYWEAIKNGEKKVMVGTRSAVFTPFHNLGLIIIDEEHDTSFKQQSGATYHGRDVAIMRACFESVPIVLGSATPALETLWNASQGRYHKLTLSKRAGGALLPDLRIVDLKEKKLEAGLSKELLAAIANHLNQQGQVLLFLNRRGFSPLYLCHGCGWIMMCRSCDAPMRFHTRPHRLRCHYCEHTTSVPTLCENCHQPQLFALGQGTQRLEAVLSSYFPTLSPIRIDADSTRKKNELQHLLEQIKPNEPNILIGTQILAKGHHFPGVSLAAVIDGDAGFFGTDFRSLERSAQLMMQVGGRAGRGRKVGEVIIQTHHPNHPLLKQLIEKGYQGFSESAMVERQKAGWPPYSYLALIRAEARHQEIALRFLEEIKNHVPIPSSVSWLGPSPALLSKKAGYYPVQLLLRTIHRADLHTVLDGVVHYLSTTPPKNVRYTLEVDPLEIC